MCVCVQLIVEQINGQMKGGWQQEEEGFQPLSDGKALENEMSLVSMAANKPALCIHITQGGKGEAD